ncbi:MAG TPA: phosphonatase-like hydrolase [Ohtaekwangia sp.]|uniref:phosphonatase-like hydrolase n=1 Tax=Ohtaekwangia sp. TaxID=2066019 RepID=UPI002F92C1AF
MAIELVVFDLAGTTVKDNKDVHRVLQLALAKHNVNISIEDANAVMGIPKPVAIRELLEKRYSGTRAIDEAWIDEIHKAFVHTMIDFYRTDASVGEKTGVSETFRKLKDSKLHVVVDTGFDRQITDPLLDRLGWKKANLIDASVTSDEVKRGRPYPDMIFRAMELTGVKDVKRVAKVGDTTSDLQEGNAAGCALVIGVTTGAFSKEELAKEKHTHLIANLHEVIEIIASVA